MFEKYNQKKAELEAEEVNVFYKDCGEIQYHCSHDCFGGGAFISTDN